jgi:hypothetical protein
MHVVASTTNDMTRETQEEEDEVLLLNDSQASKF